MKIDQKLKRKIGVYILTNNVNGKQYVGSSSNLYERLQNHFYHLKRNTHINSHLQHAYNKYGEKSFTYEIIEYCKLDNQFEREQYYIDLLNPKYNIIPSASHSYISEETKQKISNAIQNLYDSGKLINIKYTDPVYVYDINDITFCKKFSNFNELKLSNFFTSITHNRIDTSIINSHYIVSYTYIENYVERLNYISKNHLFKKQRENKNNLEYWILFYKDDMVKYCKTINDIYTNEYSISKSTLSKYIYKLKLSQYYQIPNSDFRVLYTNQFINFNKLPA